MKRFWNWLAGLFIDEFEVTIYFPGDVIELEDGTSRLSYKSKAIHLPTG